MEQDLKEFINYKMDALASQMKSLSALVESQAGAIRAIEITTTTRLTELRKDIDNAFEEIRTVKKDQDKMADSQKFKWRTLEEKRQQEEKEMAKRWETQVEINQGIRTLTKLLWVILGVVVSLGLGFVWQMIVQGGIQGLLP